MPSKTVLIVGAGTMGSGIAQVAASSGWLVHLVDPYPEALDRARNTIGSNLDRQVESGRLSTADRDVILSRLVDHPAIPAGFDADLAIEAVIEDLAVKQAVFRDFESFIPRNALLASNTSSLSVSRIAEGVREPSRVIGMHFFNPAPLMPLVEIIAGRESSAEAVGRGLDTARQWGKVTVTAKDTPGFIVNRVARGFYLEALRLLGEGVAGVDEIDAIMRTHGGFKMGPFQLMDLVGLDVNLAVSTSVWEQLGRPARLAPHPIQKALVSQGHWGRKTNRGFYRYEDGRAIPAQPVERKSYSLSPLLKDVLRAFAERAGAVRAGGTEQLVLARVLGAVLNEAAFALGEGVATAGDIDLAMIKGTNYPKGPLAWADQIGPNTMRGALLAMNRAGNDGRYEPAAMFSS